MKLATIVQARMESTRFPGKVMTDILGKPVLYRQIERLRRSELAGTIVVATSTNPADDVIEEFCLREGFLCFRGHPTDCLARHYFAGRCFKADVIVKIPSDCPLIDPAIVDRVIGYYLDTGGAYDFVSNLHPASYPDGNDVEVFSLSGLKLAHQLADKKFEREHTTPFFWENPQDFRIANVAWETGLDYSMSHRWTLDYPADLEFIAAVYLNLYPLNPVFGLEDILCLLDQQPHLAGINSEYAGVNWYRHHRDELQTITADQTRTLVDEFRQSGARTPWPRGGKQVHGTFRQTPRPVEIKPRSLSLSK
jgi:spore coat polysaccharide biosynthesis protein SpsF